MIYIYFCTFVQQFYFIITVWNMGNLKTDSKVTFESENK